MPLRDCLWESVRYFISRTFFWNLEFFCNLLLIMGDFPFKWDPSVPIVQSMGFCT